MSAVPKKYRGKKEYALVHAELMTAAQYRGVTSYQAIAFIMGLPERGSHMGKEVGHILGEISEDEVHAGRPMLSAVAVNVDGAVGLGFFALARSLNRLRDKSDEQAFWEAERDAVYATWQGAWAGCGPHRRSTG